MKRQKLTMRCSKCGIDQDQTCFYRYGNRCKNCQKIYSAKYRKTGKGELSQKRGQAKYRKTEKGKLAAKRHVGRYIQTEKGKLVRKRVDAKYRKSEKGKIKIYPHNMVNRAIRVGRLIRENCSNCGAVENVDGHHEDYNEPLAVIWLCRTCHRLRHN